MHRPFGAGQAYFATSRVKLLVGMHIIRPGPEMELVDIDADLFTAHNHQLNAVEAEMKVPEEDRNVF